ncbi:MAG: hypothetical protein IIC09_06710 [Proteobacteria bacterium]|nr:hypothetical protein [Pseudomonadota bacterium]
MKNGTRFTPTKLMLLPGLLIILIAGLIWGYRAISHQALLELAGQSRNHLTLFVSNLNGVLAKYEHLPRLISNNRRLVSTLGQTDIDQINQTNRYLEAVAITSGASDVYLMNTDGRTVAASNWNLDRSFIGKNFSFRPYFQSAINGNAGRYFALGTTSLQRGYYFSYPVYRLDEISGVIVIKINLADIETAWSDRGNHFIVTDEDGIAFLSTHTDWTYKTLYPLIRRDSMKFNYPGATPGRI